MKKLLISTALVSSVLTGVAFSQTTITGEMRIGYKTHYDGLDKIDSQRGFGTEQQINIQNKGKTNFGWDYASGFSIEVDANSAASSFDENVFIDFINPSISYCERLLFSYRFCRIIQFEHCNHFGLGRSKTLSLIDL